jgi:hypothetical protein
MGLLARVLRSSGLTHGRHPYSFLPAPGGVVPMVPNLVTEEKAIPFSGFGTLGPYRGWLAMTVGRATLAATMWGGSGE